MKSLWQKIFGSVDSSNQTAKSRLHFVLVQDRTGLSNEEMADFKEELITVIEKYFTIDKEGFDICYKREDDETALVINSPVFVRRKNLKPEVSTEPSATAGKNNKKQKKGKGKNKKSNISASPAA